MQQNEHNDDSPMALTLFEVKGKKPAFKSQIKNQRDKSFFFLERNHLAHTIALTSQIWVGYAHFPY